MRYILLLFVYIFSLSASASTPPGKPDYMQIVEKRFEFIVHELNLDDSKAKAVRPIYLEYCKKMSELFPQPPMNKKPRNQRTDAEIEADIKADFKNAKQMVALRETYYYKLRKYLTPRQIEKIYDIERNEQRKMRQHMHHNRPKN